ncbi:MAG: hypothetical protein H6737_06645 [Alphaproteobacteria bacterium]|nr:hypothetical protein [Alphaproteobacteria bacterium]
MDDGIWVVFAVLIGGAMCWQVAAFHIEQYLQANDPDHTPPSPIARLFIGKLFTTLPLLGRYQEVRSQNGLAPIGVYAFWGGLVLVIAGICLLLASV